MKKSVFAIFLLAAVSVAALTPPMGWTSWNAFTTDIDQELVEATAEAIVKKGLAAHGYAYVNVDSCWKGQRNSPKNAALQPKLWGQTLQFGKGGWGRPEDLAKNLETTFTTLASLV